MRKSLITGILILFFTAGTSFASNVTIGTSYSGGEIGTSFSDPAIGSQWAYCVEPSQIIQLGKTYDFNLVDVADYSYTGSTQGLSAAWLVYRAYNGNYASGSISLALQKELQDDIWDIFNNGTSYASDYSGYEGTLSNLFDIITPYKSGKDGITNNQDLIIYNPTQTPVPGAVWLLGSGIAGLAVLRRKRP